MAANQMRQLVIGNTHLASLSLICQLPKEMKWEKPNSWFFLVMSGWAYWADTTYKRLQT